MRMHSSTQILLLRATTRLGRRRLGSSSGSVQKRSSRRRRGSVAVRTERSQTI
jgi:hypothetical protein